MQWSVSIVIKYKKIVLAYSGGLDTSVIIPWLKENYEGCEVIAVAANVGQADELDGLEEKALKTGASKLYIENLEREFVDEYIFPTLKAGAKYEEKYLLAPPSRGPSTLSGSPKSGSRKAGTPLPMAAPAKAKNRVALS